MVLSWGRGKHGSRTTVRWQVRQELMVLLNGDVASDVEKPRKGLESVWMVKSEFSEGFEASEEGKKNQEWLLGCELEQMYPFLDGENGKGTG